MSKDYCLLMDFALGDRLRGLSGPVLITGHTGFKGTWLSLLLEKLGIPAVGLSLPAEKDSLYERANRLGAIPEIFADIRDLEAVLKCFLEFAPGVIIHLAAQPIVLESYKTPRDTFATNVLGTANVLDAAFKLDSVSAIGVVTTDKVYRNDNMGRAFIETDPLAGKDPYSASKVGAEAAVSAWQQIALVSGGPSVVSLRAGNVIGGGDWAADRLLPDLIKGFSARTNSHVRNPESTRPWQHVLDPVRGYVMAVEYLLSGHNNSAFNFGPDSESLTVRKVADLSSETWARLTKTGNANVFSTAEEGPSHAEAKSLQLDSSLSRKTLGWRPAWSQEDSVIATVTWWHKVLNESIDPIDACESDIEFLLNS